MSFDFEGYWKEHGIHTNPQITGLAFKEVAQKAVEAAFGNVMSRDDFIDLAMDNGIGGESAGACYDLFRNSLQ